MDATASLDISDLVNQITRGAAVGDTHLDPILDKLQDFECWTTYFQLLESQIDNPKKRQIHHYVRTARAYAIHLEDIQKAAKVCVKLMKDIRLGYAEFREKVLQSVIGENEFEQEAVILQAVYPKFRVKEDLIACMERLCLIYEKKKFDEGNLNKSYERLIELDPMNQKALRYFKIVYTQNNQWDKVLQVLQSLFASAKHINDRYRSAQELAAVHLYQMDQPQNAVDIIERYCADSPLNTFAIHYDAYYRLQNWDGCLRVLRAHLKKIEGGLNKAITHLKMGELLERMKRYKEAEENYYKALEYSPRMLEPYERLMDLYLDFKQWDNVLDCLNRLQEAVDDSYLKEKIQEGSARLQHAMEGPKNQGAS